MARVHWWEPVLFICPSHGYNPLSFSRNSLTLQIFMNALLLVNRLFGLCFCGLFQSMYRRSPGWGSVALGCIFPLFPDWKSGFSGHHVFGVCLPSQSALETNNQEKIKNPQTFAHLANFSKNVSVTFDNHIILIFFYLTYPQINKIGKSDHMASITHTLITSSASKCKPRWTTHFWVHQVTQSLLVERGSVSY